MSWEDPACPERHPVTGKPCILLLVHTVNEHDGTINHWTGECCDGSWTTPRPASAPPAPTPAREIRNETSSEIAPGHVKSFSPSPPVPEPCADCGATPTTKVGSHPWLCSACFWARLQRGIDALVARMAEVPAALSSSPSRAADVAWSEWPEPQVLAVVMAASSAVSLLDGAPLDPGFVRARLAEALKPFEERITGASPSRAEDAK